MNLVIRQFRSEDYPSIIDVGNAALPDYPWTVEEQRFYDEHREPKCKTQRFIAELDGKVVGVGDYDQFPGRYHPRKFDLDLCVHPDNQGKGIGSALYSHIVEALQPLDPIALKAGVREDMSRGVEFLKRRGFQEQMRGWESRLNVANFDFSPYKDVEEKTRSQGIEIRTIRELEREAERDRKLYELDEELVKDVPMPEPRTPVTYEYFLEMHLKSPDLLPDAYFVAIHNGRYIGMSNLWSSKAVNDLFTGFTCVRREYRRKGIALALKLRGIEYAKAHGHPTIRTWNNTVNRAMLSINERLGFTKMPVWITFIKVLKEE